MEWVRQWGVVILVGLVGVGLVGYGIWEKIRPREVKVEIISGNEAAQLAGSGVAEVVVDLAGAVEKPGVYKLPTNSRVGDALVVAGGLSASADREWVAATLNLAQKIEDGEKIYIPKYSDVSGNQNTEKDGEPENEKDRKININTASVSELDGLVGIGEVRAKAIIASRPYGKTEEIVSKAKIPESVYDKIKDSITVY